MNKKGYLALAAFGVGAVGHMGSAQAGPSPHVSVLKDGAPSGLVQNVYLRRHCYWHHGRRWCPRRYANYYDDYDYYPYYYAPGVFSRFHHHHHETPMATEPSKPAEEFLIAVQRVGEPDDDPQQRTEVRFVGGHGA